jgi:hypothetical protein
MFETLAFMLTVFFALVLRWEAKDLIWGLWISSLCVGYAFIVKTIIAGILSRDKDMPVAGAIIGALVLLVFFTIHFGMFHFVHSVFLNLFFPLFPMAGRDLPNVPLFILTTLKFYWPVVLANLIVKWPDFQAASFDLKDRQALMKPYSSVVKIHILIFVFAGMSALHLNRFAMYPILLFFFFPWDVLGKKKEQEGSPS